MLKLAALQCVCNDLTEVETLKGCMVHKEKHEKQNNGYSLLKWSGKHAEYNTLLLKGINKCMTA